MCAACRRHELTKLKVEDVQDKGDVMIIKILDTKNNKPRTSCVTEPLWINIIKKYMALRPPGTELRRFFLFYAKNKCSRQAVGLHSFGSMPYKIASFLKLENPSAYTGHCFRRSSATVLAGHGADITTLKRHGGWKSSAVAEAYIEDSLKSQIAIANTLVGRRTSDQQRTSSSELQSVQSDHPDVDVNISHSSNVHNVDLKLSDTSLPNISITNCPNSTINFNFK